MSQAAPSPAPVKRGRKPTLPPSDKVAALRAQLAQAEAEVRQALLAKATVVGAVVIEEMWANPEFKALIVGHLKAKVRSAKDKATIADLLI